MIATAEEVRTGEQRASVGTRISWGAVGAGVVLTLAIQFLLGILGAAVGLSISDKVNPSNIQTGAVIWAILTSVISLFVGGVVTSLLTERENKMEAVLSGIIMWAVVVAVLLFMGAAGVRGGLGVMAGMSDATRTNTEPGWEAGAKQSGVPQQQIDEWRAKAGNSAQQANDPQSQQAALDAAKRFTWYAFAATWIGMIVAAVGGYVGAGPTFRVITIVRSNLYTSLSSPLPVQARVTA